MPHVQVDKYIHLLIHIWAYKCINTQSTQKFKYVNIKYSLIDQIQGYFHMQTRKHK